jgi:hypothetical protein
MSAAATDAIGSGACGRLAMWCLGGFQDIDERFDDGVVRVVVQMLT